MRPNTYTHRTIKAVPWNPPNTEATKQIQWLAAKVSTDLKRVQRIYNVGLPTDLEIDAYAKELSLLLEKDYMYSITYGFQKNLEWIVAFQYRSFRGARIPDEDPGNIQHVEIPDNCAFHSTVSYTKEFCNASEEDLIRFSSLTPIKREPGGPPRSSGIIWYEDKSYSMGEFSIKRSISSRVPSMGFIFQETQ